MANSKSRNCHSVFNSFGTSIGLIKIVLKDNKGVTLIELLAALAIGSLLVGLLIALTQITLKSYQYVVTSNIERSTVIDASRHLHNLLPNKLTSISVPGNDSAPLIPAQYVKELSETNMQELFVATDINTGNQIEVFKVSFNSGTSSERDGVIYYCSDPYEFFLIQSPFCSLTLNGPPQPNLNPEQNPDEVEIQFHAYPINAAFGGKPYALTDWLGD